MNEGIVRADRTGRLRYTAEQRAAVLEAFASSGVSGAEFARLHGVKYQTFANWLQRRKQAEGFAFLISEQGHIAKQKK